MGIQNLIITIEREYGSGGRIVGKKLGEELGMNFYDDDLMRIASEKSAVGEQYFRLADEKAQKSPFLWFSRGRAVDLTVPSPDDDLTSPENLFRFQAQVLHELAEQQPCIFVGRAAGYILDQFEDVEKLVRVFVYSDFVTRVQRVIEVDCIDEEKLDYLASLPSQRRPRSASGRLRTTGRAITGTIPTATGITCRIMI